MEHNASVMEEGAPAVEDRASIMEDYVSGTEAHVSNPCGRECPHRRSLQRSKCSLRSRRVRRRLPTLVRSWCEDPGPFVPSWVSAAEELNLYGFIVRIPGVSPLLP